MPQAGPSPAQSPSSPWSDSDTLCQIAFLQWMASLPSLISAPTGGLLSSSPFPFPMWIAILPSLGSNTWQPQANPLQGLHSHYAQDTTPVSLSVGGTCSSSQSGHPPHRCPSHLSWALTPAPGWPFTQVPSSHLSATTVPHPHKGHQPCLAPWIGFWPDLYRKEREEDGKVEEEVADH